MIVEDTQDADIRSPLGESIDPLKMATFKAHIIKSVEAVETSFDPFGHIYIEHILPEELYSAVRAHMFRHKYESTLLDRPQDSELFVNKRFSLVGNTDLETLYIHSLFSDTDVKMAFLRKFFLDVDAAFANSLKIHKEFEYMYTAAGRFQNIHVDIPPKFLSFVFYFPEFDVAPEEELRNATVIYDKALEPHFAARYRPNSVCVFAPHFYSYHGFASTIDREVLVMFYISPDEMARWAEIRGGEETEPYEAIRIAIDDKLVRHPLIEYGRDPVARQIAREGCLINAPRGRVMKDQLNIGVDTMDAD
jgi:hypothetical protein